MRLRTKILIPKMVLIALLAAMMVYMAAYMNIMRNSLAESHDRLQKVMSVSNRIERLEREIDTGILTYVQTGDGDLLQPVRSDRKEIGELVASLQQILAGKDEAQLVRRYVDTSTGAEQLFDDLVRSVDEGKRDAIKLQFDKWNLKSQMVRATLNDLVNYNVQSNDQSVAVFKDVIAQVFRLGALLAGIVIVTVTVNMLYLQRSITVPLVALAESARRIARGEFDAKVPSTSDDEIGELARSIGDMAGNLRSTYEGLERRVAEKTAELTQRNTELARSNKELEDFAYVASHDLQEPLRKIQSFGNLLGDEHASGLGAAGRDYLDRMKNAAGRMSVLISDLLAFSRVTTRGQPFERVDLNAIVKEVLADLETRIRDTRAAVSVSTLPTVDADPLQMRQLFQNLISNGLKFRRKGKAPEIKVYASGGVLADGRACHEISVEDNGIGIEEKYQEKIFAVFQRLHTKDEYEGTGIGLAIVRKIVDRHGGAIRVRSEPKKGATFVVSMPVRHRQG